MRELIYVDENYDNYKYLVEVSNNYIVLTNQRTAGYENSYDYEEIDIIYQFFEPSTMIIEDTKNVRGYTEYTEIENRTSEFWERPDISNISIVVALIVVLTLFIINSITKFVIRGGLFGIK